MMKHSHAGPHDYPHFVVQVWGGRLPTPYEYRGTPIAKQFESGRIGGKKLIVDERYTDTADGRAAVQVLVQKHNEVDVYFVRSHRHSRERIGTRVTLDSRFPSVGIPDN